MAWITHLFRCDDCGFEVSEMVDPQNIVAPDCPHCDVDKSMAGPIPSTTAIGARNASRNTDQLYRTMEEGSAIRAEALGDPSMKMTDMPDGYYGGGLKPGDSTAPKVQNDVTRYVEQTGFKMWAHGGASSGTLEAAKTKALAGKKSDGAGGIDTITGLLQGGNGPMQFPTRVRPQE